MQIRVLSSGEIEGALWDEASSQETDFDSEVSPTVELSEILDGFLRKLLGE